MRLLLTDLREIFAALHNLLFLAREVGLRSSLKPISERLGQYPDRPLKERTLRAPDQAQALRGRALATGFLTTRSSKTRPLQENLSR